MPLRDLYLLLRSLAIFNFFWLRSKHCLTVTKIDYRGPPAPSDAWEDACAQEAHTRPKPAGLPRSRSSRGGWQWGKLRGLPGCCGASRIRLPRGRPPSWATLPGGKAEVLSRKEPQLWTQTRLRRGRPRAHPGPPAWPVGSERVRGVQSSFPDQNRMGQREASARKPSSVLRFNDGVLWVLNKHTHGRDMKGPGFTSALNS